MTWTCYRFVHLTCQMKPLFLRKSKKNHFSTLWFIYFGLFTLLQKKTNSKCCTAALAVYLLLFSASYYLNSPSTASGARYRRSACIDMDNVEPICSGLLRHGLNFSTACCTRRLISVVKEWKHILTQKVVILNTCLPGIPVATHHNRFFPEPSMTTHNWLSSEPPKNATNLQSDEKVLQFTS